MPFARGVRVAKLFFGGVVVPVVSKDARQGQDTNLSTVAFRIMLGNGQLVAYTVRVSMPRGWGGGRSPRSAIKVLKVLSVAICLWGWGRLEEWGPL